MSLIDDHQLGALVEKLAASQIALDEVGGNDDEGVSLEQGLVHHESAFEPSNRAREDEFGIDPELVTQLCLPLLGQGRTAQHREPFRVALCQ